MVFLFNQIVLENDKKFYSPADKVKVKISEKEKNKNEETGHP